MMSDIYVMGDEEGINAIINIIVPEMIAFTQDMIASNMVITWDYATLEIEELNDNSAFAIVESTLTIGAVNRAARSTAHYHISIH